MEILASGSDWIFTDAERLQSFLESETGKRFIAQLASKAPLLLASGDVNSILIRSGEVRAFSSVVQMIIDLAHPEPPPQDNPVSKAHPDLEDDSAWNDGESVAKPKDLFATPVVEQPKTP